MYKDSPFHRRLSLGLLLWWLFTSVILPVWAPLARAAGLAEMHQLMTPDAEPSGNAGAPSAAPPGGPAGSLSDYFIAGNLTPQPDAARTPSPDGTTLPLLGSPETPDAGGGEPAEADDPVPGHLQTLWGVLGQESRTDAVRGMAENYISGMANQMAESAVRDWLKQKGNARIQFTTQGEGSADVLVPLWDTGSDLLFSQAGVRRNQDRTLWNGGIGGRHYIGDDWMLGSNVFYDYDQTGRNARWGVGLEARTDWLSLSANRYFRLTDWHQSPLRNMRDYDERPANGYDLRAKYWLPSYPQLGGELTYEKYFGKGVDLLNSASPDSLKNSPHALTAAVSYTPFPLLTVSLGHTSGDVSETTAQLDFNWRFGLSLAEQLDGQSVAIMRSLKGSRYDLVDRNYNIVMQYRKQQLVALTLPAEARGEALSRIAVSATAKAKYGIRDIVWQAPELVSAGGRIETTASPTDIRIVLPAWNAPDSGKRNQYRLTAVMTDVEGNRTEPATMNIVVDEATHIIKLELDAARSPVGREVPGRLTVTDSSGQAVTGLGLTLALTPSAAGCELNGQAQCDGYESVLDAGGRHALTLSHTKSGKYTLRATLATGSRAETDIVFEADAASATLTEGSLTVVTDNAPADGSAVNRVKATVTDSFGNPVSGQTVTFAAGSGAQISGAVQTDERGEATAELSSTLAGPVEVNAGINGVSRQVTVRFVADSRTAQIAEGALSVEEDGAVADGRSANRVRARVTDANNNVVPGAMVTFSAGNGAVIAPSGMTGEDGELSLPLTSVRAGESRVTATINGGSREVTVRFIAGAVSGQTSVLTATPASIAVDNTETSQLTLALQDAQGNPVTGRHGGITFSVSGLAAADHTLSAVNYEQAEAGLYTATLKGKRVGTAVVTAQADGETVGPVEVRLTSLSGGDAVGADGSVTLDATSPVTAGEESRLTVTLKDVNGNPVTGAAGDIRVSSQVSDQAPATAWEESAATAGSYTSSLLMTKVGSHLLTATVSGSSRTGTRTVEVTAATAESAVRHLTLEAAESVRAGDSLGVTVTLTDGWGNPVTGLGAAITLGDDKENPGTVSFTEVSPGRYRGTVTLTQAGEHTLSARLGNGLSAERGVTVNAGAAVAAASTLSPAAQSVKADGVAEAAVTLELKDGYGNLTDAGAPAAGSALRQLSGVTGVSTGAWSRTETGKYRSTVKGTTVGEATFSQTVGGVSLPAVKVTFLAQSGAESVAGVRLEAIPATMNAGEETQLTLRLTDANGNGVTGVATADIALSDSVTDGNSALSSWEEGANGEYRAGLRLTVAGAHDLTATVNGQSGEARVTVTPLSGEAYVETLSLRVSPETITAGESVTATVTLKDRWGNGVVNAGGSIGLTSSVETLSGTTFSATGTAGEYAVTLPLTKVGVHTLTASARNRGLDATDSVTVNPRAGRDSVKGVTLEASKSSLKVGDSTVLKVTLTDEYGNGVTGVAGSDIAINGALTGQDVSSLSWSEGDAGVYTASALTMTIAGTHPLRATVNAQDSAPVEVIVSALNSVDAADSVTLEASREALKVGENTVLKVTVKDRYGNGVTGLSGSDIALSGALEGQNVSGLSWEESSTGVYKAELTMTKAGTHRLKATVNHKESGEVPVTVAQPNVVSVVNSVALAASVSQLVVGETTELTVTLTDAYGNGVTGLSGSDIAISGALAGQEVSGLSWSEGDAGVYTSTALTMTKAGTHQLQATVNTKTSNVVPVIVAQPNVVSVVNRVTLKAEPGALKVDETTVLEVTLTDAYGNGVTGLSGSDIAISGAKPGQDLSGLSWTEGDAGVYTSSRLVMTIAGEHLLMATVNLKNSDKARVNVANLSGKEYVSAITLTTEPADVAIEEGEDVVLSIVATDQYGNRVTGLTNSDIAIASNIAGQTATGLSWTEATGSDIGKYTSSALAMTIKGTHILTATVNGKTAEAKPLVVKRMVVISGVVTDITTDTGIKNASITITEGEATIVSTTSDLKGNFSIRIAEGEYTIKASAAGYLDTDLTTSDLATEARKIAMIPEIFANDIVVIHTTWAPSSDVDVALYDVALEKMAGFKRPYDVEEGKEKYGMSWDRDDKTGSNGGEVTTIRKSSTGSKWKYLVMPYSTGARNHTVTVKPYVIDPVTRRASAKDVSTITLCGALYHYKQVLTITRSGNQISVVKDNAINCEERESWYGGATSRSIGIKK
jgi:adhesin/invasin